DSPTAISSAAPLNTGLTHALAPDRVRPLTLTATNSTPMIVPTTLKNPGTTAVAPRNAAASAGKSRFVPGSAVALPVRASCITPTIPAMAPASANVVHTEATTRTPTSLAERGLD